MFVCPFTIVVDNNEQLPYTFENMPWPSLKHGPVVVKTKVASLDTGDYSIAEYEDQIAIERKTIEDLYGTLGRGRARFERELERLSKMRFGAIVIEADLCDVWRPHMRHLFWRSKVPPQSVEGTIVSWSLTFPTVHWWCCGTRRMGEVRTFNVLRMFWRKFHVE